MPGAATVIGFEALHGVVAAWCRRRGFSDEDAATAATVIVDADLHGAHSHGVRLLVGLIPEIERGTIDPAARPTVIVDRGATAVLDGHHGFGPVVCSRALEHAQAAARRHGLAAVAVRHSSHWGRPAYYGRVAAENGLILVALSNSASAMPVWGATVKSVGNNPIVLAVPRTAGPPVVLDISMQVAAWGRIRLLRDEGRPIPIEWGFDANGAPTDDPAALLASGRVRPVGDHKGSGLAMIFELLTAGLAGGLHSAELTAVMDAGGPQHKSQLFLALDPEAFAGGEALARVVTSFAASIEGLERQPGVTPPRLPGQGSDALRERHLREGIPLSPSLAAAIDRLR